MGRILVATLLLFSVLGASQNVAPAKRSGAGNTPSPKKQRPAASGRPRAADMRCEPLPPFYRSDASLVLEEKIGPNEASPTGNSFFMMPHPVKYVVVHLTPGTSDDAAYPVKIITRYIDDTIYENVMDAIVPQAGTPIEWGPLETVPASVPKTKVPDILIVKVQENYLLQPNAKGFAYKLSVEGCN